MKKLYILILIFIFSGCQFKNSNLARPKIDSTLPTIDAQTIKYISDINGIVFEWEPVDDVRVTGYKIFRTKYTGSRKKLFEVGQVDGRYSSHFYDKELNANSSYTYRFATIGKNNSRSAAGDLIKVKTLPSLEEVTFISSTSNLPKRIKVFWKPHNSHRVNGYIIYKAEGLKRNWAETTVINGRLNAEYVDYNLGDNKTFRYKIVATTFDGLKSLDSMITTATSKALPPLIQNVTLSQDIPKRIDLSWDATKDSIGKDIDYYLIYGSNFANHGFRKIAKNNANSYIDMVNEDGKGRYYKVIAVDIDGLAGEMPKISSFGKTRTAPKPPVIISAKLQDNVAVIRWESQDKRAVSFTIIKKIEQKWYDRKKIEYITDIRGEEFIDNKVESGVVYKYSVMSLDELDVQSQPTREIKISIPVSSNK